MKTFIIFPENRTQVFMTVLFIFFAYILTFLLHCIIGMLSFWLLETQALDVLLSMTISVLSGVVFPIDFMNNQLGFLLKYLPFSYLAFVPTQIYIGKINGTVIMQNIIICLVWIFVLALIAGGLWKNGIRKYAAFGG